MKLKSAEKLVHSLTRYSRRKNYNWRSYDKRAYREDPKGRYIQTLFWRRVPKAVDEAVHKIMQRKDLFSKVMEINFSRQAYDNFWTIQDVLHMRNMTYILRRLPQVVAGSKPVLFYVRGKYIIWNGHHRMTCAALLGRRIKCKVFKAPSSK